MADAKTTFVVGELVEWDRGTVRPESDTGDEIVGRRPPGPFRITHIKVVRPPKCDCDRGQAEPHRKWCAAAPTSMEPHPQLVRMVSAETGEEFRANKAPCRRLGPDTGWITGLYLKHFGAHAPTVVSEVTPAAIIVPLIGTRVSAEATPKATQLTLFQMS